MIKIDLIRKKIDKLDKKICTLLKRRIKNVKAISLEKKSLGLAIEDKLREDEILSKLSQNLNTEEKLYIERIYKEIFNVSKDIQR